MIGEMIFRIFAMIMKIILPYSHAYIFPSPFWRRLSIVLLSVRSSVLQLRFFWVVFITFQQFRRSVSENDQRNDFSYFRNDHENNFSYSHAYIFPSPFLSRFPIFYFERLLYPRHSNLWFSWTLYFFSFLCLRLTLLAQIHMLFFELFFLYLEDFSLTVLFASKSWKHFHNEMTAK